MEHAVEAEGLVKEYRPGWLRRGKTVRALDGVSLKIVRGSLYSLLGPNGAGKTTLIKILSTLLLPDQGWARVAGYDVVREASLVRARIGVVLGGERALYWRLTAWDNLWFFSQLYGMPRAEARRRVREMLELVGLWEWAGVRVENFSKGMKQRLHIARGLLHDPEVLLLDEPTIGLDPASAREVRALIRRIVSEGRTVLLTTHYLPEAEELSDRIGIIFKGRIVAEGAPSDIRRLARLRRVEIRLASSDAGLEGELASLASRLESERRDGVTVYTAYVEDVDGFMESLTRLVSSRGVKLRGVEVKEPSLEDVFISLTSVEVDG